MGTEGTPGLQERVVAAAGASVVAALIVNPLDVVKVRIQAQAASCSVKQVQSSRPLLENCMRHLPPQCECSMTAIRQYCLWQGALPHNSLAVSTLGVSGQLMAVRAPLLNRSWAISSCPVCDAPGQLARGGCASKNPNAYKGMWDAARQIVQKEGFGVLWRGSRTSLMLAVPMVGIYMPIYDYLVEQLRPMGLAAPVIAGAVSRSTAVFACAPLEMMRTRVYANVASMPWTAATATPAAPLQSTTALSMQLSRIISTVPRLWTGFTATLARDVPFSMLYWGMLEPIRAGLLKQMSLPSLPTPSTAPQPTRAAELPASTALAPDEMEAVNVTTSGTGISAEAASDSDPSMRSVPTSVPSSSTSGHAPKHSHMQLLSANLAAGSVAGGLAAAVTTPFDVVKTRQQVFLEQSEGLWPLMKRIYRQEGLRGLYRGVGPRSARAAPACAIVISVYELLKNSLVVIPEPALE